MNKREKITHIRELIEKKESHKSSGEYEMYDEYYGLVLDFNKHFLKIEEKIGEIKDISGKKINKRLGNLLSVNRKTLLEEIKMAEKNLRDIRKYL